jgi:hypothetical protein
MPDDIEGMLPFNLSGDECKVIEEWAEKFSYINLLFLAEERQFYALTINNVQ